MANNYAPVPWSLVKRYDRPLPRYTSYPTVPHWGPQGESSTRTELRRLGAEPGSVSLYVHLPFCARMCSYCGCTTVIAKGGTDTTRYLAAVEKELRLVREEVGDRWLGQLHFGGGTPTFYSPEQLEWLTRSIFEVFTPTEDAELSIEIDPTTAQGAHFDSLAHLGFNRVSLGVQDFDSEVQTAVGRHQDPEVSRAGFRLARAAGFEHINVDLMYGLPCQMPDHVERSAREVVELGAERVALFGYAHVPWIKPHQKKLEVFGLPGPEQRHDMFEAGRRVLVEAGYHEVGFDHFAKADDELVTRATDLHRNFQGYTVLPEMPLIGLGMSAISDLGTYYGQNEKRLSSYLASVESGRLATVRGLSVAPADEVRRRIIVALMCRLEANLDELAGPSLGACLTSRAQVLLAPLIDDGLLTLAGATLQIAPLGRRFLRQIAAVFDSYLGGETTDRERFSQAV